MKTINCPFCGEKNIVTEKKCNHCGECLENDVNAPLHKMKNVIDTSVNRDVIINQTKRFAAIKPYLVKIPSFNLINPNSRPTVDLRPQINQLGLSIRSQEARGTCSVFAVTFVLEFMYRTRINVAVTDLSEEYLNFASNEVVGIFDDGSFFHDLDKGYIKHGIVPESKVPYQSTQVTTIDRSILDEGSRWSRLQSDFIKPWDSSKGASNAQIDRVTAYLDQGIPVCFGGFWPTNGNYRITTIHDIPVMDTPDRVNVHDGHSIVLVGYRRQADFPGGGYFIYRNSWGDTFGDQGYAYMSFKYVKTYANDLLAYKLRSITSVPGSKVAVTHQPDSLRIAVADARGEVFTAAWDASLLNGKWRGWWSVLGGRSSVGANIDLVARDAGKLDAFITGTDGRTYTAATCVTVDNAQWRGWWNILTGCTPVGGTITAISRKPNQLDVFIVSNDGGIYTAAWNATANKGQWAGWWRIGNLTARPGSQVTCVSRDANKLDIFVSGNDGKTYTAAWDANVDSGKWRGWWNILTGRTPVGGTITAVSRKPNQLDVFIVSNDGGIYTAAWSATVNNGQWAGWWRIGNLTAKPGSQVTCVSRDANKLDIFVSGNDGKIYTAAWDANVDSGKWRGWWNILTGRIPVGGTVTAVSRKQNQLDVFIVSNDGGIYTAAWNATANNGQWAGWWCIG